MSDDDRLAVEVSIGGRSQGDLNLLLANVIVQRGGPIEAMQISVMIPDQGNEARNKLNAVAQAKNFAIQFVNDRSGRSS